VPRLAWSWVWWQKAIATESPLLFKGNDFAARDVLAALPS
jgi:uncharacterized protein with PIN domain